MAERHDRMTSNGGTFALGAIAGALVGAGLGILFAPKTGFAMRRQISKNVGTLTDQARGAYREARAQAAPLVEEGQARAEKWAERGKDTYSEVREAASRVVG